MSYDLGAVIDYADQMESVSTILTLGGLKLYNEVLKPTAEVVALTIVPPVLTIQFMLIGVKIAMKASFLEHFVQFTTTVILAFILITLQWPQKMILAFQDKVTDGCKLWSGEILAKKGGDATGDVIKSWYEWLGGPLNSLPSPAPSGFVNFMPATPFFGKARQDSNKMGLSNILYLFEYGGNANPDATFLGINPGSPQSTAWRTTPIIPAPPSGSPQQYGEAVMQHISSLNILGLFNLAFRMFTQELDSMGSDLLRKIQFIVECIVQGILLLLIGPMFLGQITMIGTAKATIYLLPPVTKLAMVIGSQYALYLTLGLGLCLIPLIFFGSMNQMWVGYIKFCISLALIPGFYYIFSAIGYYVVSDIYNYIILPASAGGVGLPSLIKNIIVETFFVVSLELFPWLHEAFQLFMLGVVLFAVTLALYNAGVTLIAALAAGGISFASLAPIFAKKWDEAFAVDGLSEQIVKIFNAAQTSISSSMGQAMSQATSMLGSVSASGIAKAAGGG